MANNVTAADIPPCPVCHNPYRLEGAERYWEARWRDEKAENDRLRATPAVVVPNEPTPEMLVAGRMADEDCDMPGQVYRAMIAAAPAHTATPARPQPMFSGERDPFKSIVEWTKEAATPAAGGERKALIDIRENSSHSFDVYDKLDRLLPRWLATFKFFTDAKVFADGKILTFPDKKT